MMNEKMPPNKLEDEERPPIKKEDEDIPKRFMDVNIYTVNIENNQISEIISHTKDATTPNEIKKEAEKILQNKNKKNLMIGNLYYTKYSYRYDNSNQIIIMDNTEINHSLQLNLFYSILIFIIFEITAYFLCQKISHWIIKPVEDSFLKQKQFIADASHELKTPLSVIMASAEAMESDNDRKWLHNIQSESNRMSDLIKELLDLAKLENEDQKVSFVTNDLSKLVEMAVLPLESLIYEKNIHFEYDIEDNIMFPCHSNEIKQLVTILMDNAIKHCKREGDIYLSLKKENSSIRFLVKNEGEPIPSGEEEKIFERFYRVDKARSRNENRYGLGLAIAKKIVENHCGSIKAYSKDGYTTFEVVFKN